MYRIYLIVWLWIESNNQGSKYAEFFKINKLSILWVSQESISGLNRIPRVCSFNHTAYTLIRIYVKKRTMKYVHLGNNKKNVLCREVDVDYDK